MVLASNMRSSSLRVFLQYSQSILPQSTQSVDLECSSYFRTVLNTDQQYVGPIEINLNPISSGNQTVDAVWDLTDITYVLRGTIVLGGAYSPGYNGPVPTPSTTYSEPPSPTVSLTIQAALPGTVLADGEVIPNPGASVVVKLLSENTANGAGSLTQYGSTGLGASEEGGAGFIAGVDDTVDNDDQPARRSRCLFPDPYPGHSR